MSGIHQFAATALTEAMLSLKLLSGDKKKIMATMAYKQFYPHLTGHYLGMDVHDQGVYTINNEPRKFEPGMVFTIEPGFYIQPSDSSAPEKYRGIGVRIEDDILITKTGCEVLTKDAPKEIKDMQAIIGSKPWLYK